MHALRPSAEVFGRLLIATLFIVSAIGKISAYEDTVGYMLAFGVPGALLPLVIGFEFLAGLVVVIGWVPRLTAAALAMFCLVSALLFHSDLGNEAEQVHFLKNLAIAGALLCLALRVSPRAAEA